MNENDFKQVMDAINKTKNKENYKKQTKYSHNSLDLSDKNLGSCTLSQVKEMAEALGKLDDIKCILLLNNNLGAWSTAQIQCFFDSLKQQPNLTNLNLQNNALYQWDIEQVDAFVKSLKKSTISLNSIDLTSNQIIRKWREMGQQYEPDRITQDFQARRAAIQKWMNAEIDKPSMKSLPCPALSDTDFADWTPFDVAANASNHIANMYTQDSIGEYFITPMLKMAIPHLYEVLELPPKTDPPLKKLLKQYTVLETSFATLYEVHFGCNPQTKQAAAS